MIHTGFMVYQITDIMIHTGFMVYQTSATGALALEQRIDSNMVQFSRLDLS